MKSRNIHAVRFTIIITLLGLLFLLNNQFKLYSLNHLGDRPDYKRAVSIMTCNISASNLVSFPVSKQKQLMEIIKQEKPDIICFQELSFDNLRMIKSHLDSIYGPCEILKGDNQMWRLRLYSHYPLRDFKRHKCIGGIKIDDLTDDEKAEVALMQKQMHTISAEFEVEPGKWVKVFSGHLRSNAYSTARRSMEKDASWFDGISLYKRNYEVGKRIRDYEAENVRRFVDTARDDEMPVIVAGDLNDWCGSDCLNTLMGDNLKDAWWEGGNGFGWTYFGWHLRLRLDHILYSDELELVDVKVIDTDISDHKPLMAKFRFRN